MELQKEYTLLFNAVSDALRDLQEIERKLMTAQQEAEKIYMERTD